MGHLETVRAVLDGRASLGRELRADPAVEALAAHAVRRLSEAESSLRDSLRRMSLEGVPSVRCL
jgi:hypothetical protein